jgi:serine/threonine protein kinase
VEIGLIEDLLKECVKMFEFDHPNVLKLSGVCLDGGPAPYIVMPYMNNGSLLAYLKEERTKLVLDPNGHSDDLVG